MSKIFNFYTKNENGENVDKTWYQSSNLRYTECIDHDNDLKTLKVIFNNGSQYQYDKVNVNHYLLLREDASQGKALNKYIKANGYEFTKLENADLAALEGELNFRMEGGIFVYYKTNDEKLIIKDNKDNVLLEKNVKFTQASFDAMCDALHAVGKELYIDVDYPIDDNGEEQKIIESNLPF